jgi:hypothetical protein
MILEHDPESLAASAQRIQSPDNLGTLGPIAQGDTNQSPYASGDAATLHTTTLGIGFNGG